MPITSRVLLLAAQATCAKSYLFSWGVANAALLAMRRQTLDGGISIALAGAGRGVVLAQRNP